MRKLVGAMLGAALTLGSTVALAQQRADRFGTKMTAAFSADRLFGIYFGSVTENFPPPPNGPGDVKSKWTSFGLGWQGGLRGGVDSSPYAIPRFAFDFFVIDGLSIGGSLGYASLDYRPAYNYPNPTEAHESAWIIYPRVGYVWMFSDAAGFWLRGGISFAGTDNDIDAPNATTGYRDNGLIALSFDPMFVLSPTPHFGFLIGPTFDWNFAGTRENRVGGRFGGVTEEHDIHYLQFGITVGLLGWI